MRTALVAQGGPNGYALAAALAAEVRDAGFDRLDVAVAYASAQGVAALCRILSELPSESRWVIGLDDAITQPEALELVAEIPGAVLRVAALAPSRRFHPKLYHFWTSRGMERSVSALGSGNLTERGLQLNAEAAVILVSDTADDSAGLRAQFEELWNLGHSLTAEELASYRVAHAAAVIARHPIAVSKRAPFPPEANAPLGEFIPEGRPSEFVLATCVARIAALSAGGICTFSAAYKRIPLMVPLPAVDLADERWKQRVRNIKSNDGGGDLSSNFVVHGYLEHVPRVGYRITDAGRDFIKNI